MEAETVSSTVPLRQMIRSCEGRGGGLAVWKIGAGRRERCESEGNGAGQENGHVGGGGEGSL